MWTLDRLSTSARSTHRSTIASLTRITSEHAARVHDHLAQDLHVTSLEADGRHGFMGRKNLPCWEATVIDLKAFVKKAFSF